MALRNDIWLDSAAIISQKNGLIYIGYGSSKRAQFQDQLDPQKPVFFIPDFFLSSPFPWVQYDNQCELSIMELDKELDEQIELEEIIWDIQQEDLFNEAFHDLQEAFAVGKLEKAVPYVFAYTSQKMSKSRLIRSLKNALAYIQNYPGYLYGCWDDNNGFLGVTPEVLFQPSQDKRNTLHTMALAGTQKSNDSQVEFETNEKELKEHQLVIRGIAETLQHLGKITIGDTSVLKLPTLKHLMTPIELELNQPFDFASIVQNMHPTPALGAFPRKPGKVWLENYQSKLDRKNYGAPFGIQFGSIGLSICLVAIRQVQWNEQGMRIGAGCGIIKNSQLKYEREEVQLKIRAIRNLLAL